MSSAKTIVRTAPDPRGRFIEGILDSIGGGTVLPGTLVTPKNVALAGGRHTWEQYNRDANGNRALICVVREFAEFGRGVDDPYADGERMLLYVPVPGDELLVRVGAAGTGTGDALTIGQYLIVVDGTGHCIATTGSPESEPFVVMEQVDDVVAGGTLVDVMFTGY